jgi:hypothetical protein
MFNKAEIGMRIFQQNWNQSNNFTSYKDVAFTDGENAEGDWPINITGTAATVTTNATLTGDISSTGNTTSINPGVIVNADISSTADITLTKLATGSLPTGITVASANIVDGTITNADISSTAGITLTKLATGELPTGITVASVNIANGSIVNADINSSAGITLTKLATGSLPSGITVASANIVNGTITNADISSTADITLTKLANGALPIGITVASVNIADGSIVNDDISSNAGILDTKLSSTGNYQPATVSVVELTQVTGLPTTGKHKIVIINPNSFIQGNQFTAVYLPQSPKLGDIIEIIPGLTPGPYPNSYQSKLRPATYGPNSNQTQQLIINNTSQPLGITYNIYDYYKFICTLQAGPGQGISKWTLVEYQYGFNLPED